MKRILFVATVPEHFRCFYLPYFALFKKYGWEVSCACCCAEELTNCDYCYDISISRSPFDRANISAFKQLKGLIRDNKYQIIHCNTPTGGAIARLAARKARKHGSKVIYTAHGFHFFTGAPLLNWLLYFPVERVLSRITDYIITINSEDYRTARKYFKAKEIVHVHGVGYDNERFRKASPEEKEKLRRKFGYASDDILLVYVAELNENKNQKLLINAFKTVLEKNDKFRLLLVGPDRTDGKNRDLADKLNIRPFIEFFGYRVDVHEIIPMCDITVASSIREGLPVNIMESLACGVPVIASDNRGHRELVKHKVNGFLVKPDNPDELALRVLELTENPQMYETFSNNAIEGVTIYGKDRVIEEMKAVYGEL